MRRLMTKFWKEIAYAVGFVLLTFSPFEGLFLAYGLAGTAWFVVWLLRNNDSDFEGREATEASERGVRLRQERYLNDHWTRSYHS
ncbi:hypothetical protein ACFMBG_22505 [Leisingera sp. D0M16]|uniref:hypothetical protein n=1 Tax=Leisingera coralii TaxID=3351347 RepID=UPI003B7679CE